MAVDLGYQGIEKDYEGADVAIPHKRPRACGYDKSEIARIGYQNQTSQSQDSYLLENVNSKKNCRIAYICEKL